MKKIIACLLVILACTPFYALAGGGVSQARDLMRDGAAADAIHGALLLALVSTDCRYCKQVLNDYLIPMSHNKAYNSRLIMRQLVVDDNGKIRDFDGHMRTAAAIAGRYGDKLTPTILLLDSRGRLLADPLVGLTTPDYYGAFLDQAIDEAVTKARAHRSSAAGNGII